MKLTTPTSKIKYRVHEFSLENDGDFMDVRLHGEGWLEITLETTGKFTFETEEEIDFVCLKLKEALKQTKL